MGYLEVYSKYIQNVFKGQCILLPCTATVEYNIIQYTANAKLWFDFSIILII